MLLLSVVRLFHFSSVKYTRGVEFRENGIKLWISNKTDIYFSEGANNDEVPPTTSSTSSEDLERHMCKICDKTFTKLRTLKVTT